MKDFVCHNCGKCCGPVPINEKERKRIALFLRKHPEIRREVKEKPFSIECIFRDSTKGCLIYSCRPEVCRLFTCSSDKWASELKKTINPLSEIHLINECFGADSYKEMYEELFEIITQNIKF